MAVSVQMEHFKQEEDCPEYAAVTQAYQGWEHPYDTDASRAQLVAKLRAKHALAQDDYQAFLDARHASMGQADIL